MTDPATENLPDDIFPDHLPGDLVQLLRDRGCVPDAVYAKLGITVTAASPERVAGTMPVAGNTQPFKMLHGGASLAFAETLASIAAFLHAGPARVAVGIEVSATHHRFVRSGLVHGEAVPLHRGRAIVTYETVIRDDHRRRVCSARISCAIHS